MSAPDSTATLPARFTVMAPTANVTISRASSFAINGDPAAGNPGDPMEISLSGSCVDSLSKPGQTDNGQVTITPGELKMKADSQQTTCPVRLTLTRRHPGSVDKAYGSGTFSGVQQRTTSINSTP